MTARMPSVLIVGATGNLGSQLCTTFQEKGWNVSGTSRSVPSRLNLARKGIRPYEADMTDPESLKQLAHQMTDVDTLVMNAGILKARSHQDFMAVNAHGPYQTFNALAQFGKLPKRVVHISSQLAGGDLEDPVDRFRIGGLTVVDPDHAREIMSNYAMSKAIGELLAYSVFVNRHRMGRGFISLRPAGILGAKDKVITKLMVGGLKGIGIAGAYPNFTTGEYPQISVIRDRDLATVTEHVARENLIDPRFGIFDVENGEEGLYPFEIVEAGRRAFGTRHIFTPRLPGIFKLIASAEEFSRRYGRAIVLDKSRIAELQNPNLATSNERLYEAFPGLKEIPLQTFEEILRDVA